jgi:hypothetical protein
MLARPDPGVNPDPSYHGVVRDIGEPGGWDVEGPVRAEIFMVWLNGDRLELTGPDGAMPWLVQLEDAEHPVEVVDRIVNGLVGAPMLAHSTSWRRDGTVVVLSFVVAIGPNQVSGMESTPIGRAQLARSAATRAPTRIGHAQVLEHGLRHLAWLAQDDPVVARLLSTEWRQALSVYVPEPFRSFS